jgi:hypothetical protein
MTLATDEFIRRFSIHVPPKGLHRIRGRSPFLSHHSFCQGSRSRVPAENIAIRPYRSGRQHWIKVKNRKHPAMSPVMEASS